MNEFIRTLSEDERKTMIGYNGNWKNDYHYLKPPQYRLECNICGYSKDEHWKKDEKTNDYIIKHNFEMSALESDTVKKHKELYDKYGSNAF